MLFTYNIYVVEDVYGKKQAAVADDGSETVQICGMVNAEGECEYFESEAYHLPYWCTENNFKLTVIEKTEEI